MAEYERIGTCAGCGNNCCTLLAIPLNIQNRERFGDWMNWADMHGVRFVQTEVGEFAVSQNPCKYLTEDGKCGVYGKPERPRMCDRWPSAPWELELLTDKGKEECTYSFVPIGEK